MFVAAQPASAPHAPDPEERACPPSRSATCTSRVEATARHQGDPPRRRPHRPRRRDPRDHGPQRLGQVHPGLLHRRPPEVHHHRRHGHPRRRGRPRDDRRRAGPRRPVPRHAVPRRGPRRVRVATSCAPPRPPIRGEAPKLRTWVKDMQARDGRPRDGPRLRRAQRQRGLLRRREEAPRDPPAGAAQAQDRDPRRDRLRPRRRRAAGRLRGRQPRPRSGSDIGVLLITHYTRILRYIKPDFVHVFVDGRIVEEGGPELAERLEDEGYDRYRRHRRQA